MKAKDRTLWVLLDSDDYVALDGRSLSLGSHGYVQMWNRPGVCLLHRWVMSIGPGVGYTKIVDHINHDVLDCRRSNLRVVTPTVSNLNRRVEARELPLGVYRARSGRFVARLQRHRQFVYIGTFDTPGQASAAVTVAAGIADAGPAGEVA